MKTSKVFALPMFLVALAGLLALPAAAQTTDDIPPDMATPPRLSVAEGDVQFWRPGSAAWEPAQLNAALAEGDSINVGDDGTVELQIGARDYVRLMAGTSLTLEANDSGMIHFRLGSGVSSFDLRGIRPDRLVRIDTEDANIVVGGRGYYRISAHDGETRLLVRNQGRATLTFVDGRNRSIGSGEEIVVRNGGASIDSHGAPPPDAWDRWNDARSDYYAAAVSNRYVPDDVYGAADLDQYGRWREDSTYGWIWMPAVAPGWAPYSTGNWRWDPFYGWTWVDVAPWGWTTCHYGRWVSVGGYWAWAPGPRRARVVYAPALVAFFQGPVGMSWVALGWGEPLVPWWGRPGFRGSVWWGGWAGPRVNYRHEHYEYRNRAIGTAVITVRETEFGHQRIHGSTVPLAPNVNLRPIRGDLPVHFAPERNLRRDIMPPRPRLEPVPQLRERRGEPVQNRDFRPQSREAVPQQPRIAPAPEGSMTRQQVVIPPQRPIEAGPRQPQHEQRERPRFEQRREEPRPAPIAPPVMAPQAPMTAPVIQPQPRIIAPAPEMRREQRHEERIIMQREPQHIQPQRVEPPRMEMPRPQMQQMPSAPQPEAQRHGGDRERPGRRDGDRRPRGPGERD
jgi:hypothetical protein